MFLNGVDATTGASDTIEFEIPPYAFMNYDPDKQMTIKLISAKWYTNAGSEVTQRGSYVVTASISNRNAYSTNSRIWLATGEYYYELISGAYLVQSVNTQASCELNCAMFTNITFQVSIGNSASSQVFTTDEKTDMSFVLQIDYE